ncbi:hypothetical protein L873DRAFT_1726039, partial [Choiromyces venosus 120613-1]
LQTYIQVFGRGTSWIEIVFNSTLLYIYNQRKEFLYWDIQHRSPEQHKKYYIAIDTPGNRIYGFIDETHCTICQPGTVDQKVFYSGYKKAHTIKFQAIMASDGLIIHLAGPYEGTLGDWSMYAQSKFGTEVWPTMQLPNGEQPLVYGDPAYFLGLGVIGAYHNL